MSFQLNQTTARQIVETVKNVCGKDINFIRPDGIIFASTDESRIGDYHEIGHEAARTGQTIEVQEGEIYHGTQPGVNMPFFWKGTLIAVIGVTGSPGEVRPYAKLARRIMGLILRERELDLVDRSRRNRVGYIVNALISGQPLDRDFLTGFLGMNRLSDRRLFRTVVVIPRDAEKSGLFADSDFESADIIQSAGTELCTFRYPDEYVILCEDGKQDALCGRLLANAPGGTPGFRIGIGSPESVYRQEHSYQTAQLALKSLRGEAALASYESLDMELLFSTAQPGIRRLLTAKTADLLDGTDRACLEAYFSSDFSVKAASEKLFIHKNTLQYHLDRTFRLTGYNPRVFRDAVVLWTGLQLRKDADIGKEKSAPDKT